ncbi:hypothetical protein [Shewanella livingstonensis]|uniref:Uncharacterized protein n=1 Tax=Shewanella livingstonensis TaxID=150120 RepID=A0A3G8LQU3_9GAMM|nr:hypothetical protein [Shewanella livingstonensis]AZG71909.1 hypothetical protein EGC82_03500 [Shewanella livingstonensis]
MNQFNDLFIQTYWWLSLLGGIHCLGVGLYVHYIYQSNTRSHSLLAGIFLLIGCYFLTGLLTQETTPIPIHLTLTLFIPIYFLLMPMLYLYCKSSLTEQDYQPLLIKHFGCAILVTLVTSSAILFHISIDPKSSNNTIASLAELNSISLLAVILPILLMLQTISYFWAIYRLLSHYRPQYLASRQPNLQVIRFRWLSVLTIGILINWVLRIVLVYLPFYLGDSVPLLIQAVTRLSLLLTVYVFALYGIQQVTRSAYLRGILNSTSNAATPTESTTNQLLDDDEITYLHQLMAEQDEQDTADHSAKNSADKKN